MARRKKVDFGSGKMRDLKSVNLKEGRTYYMGASSSPQLIYVEDVGSGKVTYRTRPYYPENKKTRERDIIEDLVAQGNQTVRESRRPNKFINRKTDLKEIQRRKITFKIKENSNISPIDVERKYRDKYGLETNRGTKDGKFKTTVNWDDVSDIRQLPEIRVLESKKPRA